MHFSVHILPAVAAAAGVNSAVIPRLVQKFILIHFTFGQRQIELFCDPSIKFFKRLFIMPADLGFSIGMWCTKLHVLRAGFD